MCSISSKKTKLLYWCGILSSNYFSLFTSSCLNLHSFIHFNTNTKEWSLLLLFKRNANSVKKHATVNLAQLMNWLSDVLICIYVYYAYIYSLNRENIIKCQDTIYMLWTLYWVNVRKLIGTYVMKIFPKKTHLYVRNVFCFNNVLECVQVFTNQLNTLEFERISFLNWRASNWFDLEYQLFTS